MFELKQLSQEGIPGALAKAERYRLLNEPQEAESIYQDVLRIDADNQDALIGLLLAVSDQFDDNSAAVVKRAREVLDQLHDEYARAYYGGLICERRAKAILRHTRHDAHRIAYTLLSQAKECYEKAEALHPPGNDDVLLRWNACARLLQRHPRLSSVSDEREERYEPYGDA